MSKILIITPIYKIVGRNDLFKDSEAVHYLIKDWKKDNDIYVINMYINGLSHIFRYRKYANIQGLKSGFDYFADDIPVTLIERQRFYKNQINGFKFEKKRFKKIIDNKLEKQNFNPEIIVVHMPSVSRFLLENEWQSSKKIAVLHKTDMIYLNQRKEKFIKYLNENFESVYCRNKKIYSVFKKANLLNLKKEIIYSGVPNNAKERIVSKSKKKNILFVGKLIKNKNLDILIKALANLNKDLWTLNVVGKGKKKKEYIKLAKKLKLDKNINFIGTYPREKVFELMREADIFCMPSVNETLGLVYLEAMSQGCITIGTKDEGIDGIIVNEKNGFLVEPNIASVYSTILKVLNMNNDQMQKISDSAVQTAKYYNDVDMSTRYLNIIKNSK